MSQGGAEATRGSAGGDRTYVLESAKGDQCERQKPNADARPLRKPLRLAFYGKMPEAPLRESNHWRNFTVEGLS